MEQMNPERGRPKSAATSQKKLGIRYNRLPPQMIPGDANAQFLRR